MSDWTDHVKKWRDCTACPLHQQRDNIVLARGQVPADIVFVGEAPGASEDALGQPFKGPAGYILDQIIDRALPTGMSYAMTNLVCCFPRDAKMRGDNEPEHSEILACRPRLVEFVRLCQPRLVVLVGSLAAGYACGSEHPDWMPDGKLLTYCEIVHPAAILRMPQAQKQMAVQRAIVVLQNAVESMLQ